MCLNIYTAPTEILIKHLRIHCKSIILPHLAVQGNYLQSVHRKA